MTTNKTATIFRDEEKNLIIEDGQITCICDDGLTFKISVELIDFNCDTLRCNVDGNDIDVSLRCDSPLGMSNNTWQDTGAAVPSQDLGAEVPSQNTGNDAPSQETPADAPSQNAPFVWTDASTKLLLSLYKDKKDLVTSRRIKTWKMMWKQISEEMFKLNYRASPIQVENKFKTMERAFKNMVSVNKKTGRGRVTCSYHSELTELLGNKHSIAPLAVSGRTGLKIRPDDAGSNNTEDVSEVTMPSTSSPTSPPSSTSTRTHHDSTSSTSSSNGTEAGATNSSRQGSRMQLGSTAKSLMQCKEAIENMTKEIKEQRINREKVQLEILAEQKKMVKLYEELIEEAKEQRAFANEQREEKNKLLKQVLELVQSQKNDK